MAMNSFRKRFPVLAIALASTLASAEGYCPNTAGWWTDSDGYWWFLQQSGPGYGSVTGSVYVPECGGPWPVSGYTTAVNQVVLTATNPRPFRFEICNLGFVYIGQNFKPGCNLGAGIWINAYTSGSLEWSKSCLIPQGETSFPAGNNTAPTVTTFYVTLAPSGLGTFEGRTVHELNGTAWDGCWQPADSSEGIDETTGATTGYQDVNGAGSFGDDVGLMPDVVDYYRAHGRAPCSVMIEAPYEIDCSFGGVYYKVTHWQVDVFESLVQNTRDGASDLIPY